MTTSRPMRLSAMHHQHLGLGAVMVESDGWQRPARYTSMEYELEQVRRSVGLCDVSPVGKIALQGTGLDSLLTSTFGDIGSLDIGAVSRLSLDNGSALQSVVVARLARDEMMVLTGPSQLSEAVKSLERPAGYCAHVVDITSALAGVRIVGPLAPMLLSSVTELDAATDAFANMSCAQASFAEVHGVLLRADLGGLGSDEILDNGGSERRHSPISRGPGGGPQIPTEGGRAGKKMCDRQDVNKAGDFLSYELYFGREFAEYLWDALIEVGQEYEVTPFGIEAMARLQ